MNLDVDPYGTEETVLFSFRDPDMLIHSAREECSIEQPHYIDDCKIFNPIKDHEDTRADKG